MKMLEDGGEFVLSARCSPLFDSSALEHFSRTHADVWHAQRYFLAERRAHTLTTALQGSGQRPLKILVERDLRQRCCSMCKSSKC